ncbi:hypothetical protein BH23CHL7_BH23CHL7_08230 [soil metagenome]
MKHDAVFEGSRFVPEWIRHELSQFGAEELATYLARDDAGPDRRVLVATDLGVLDLRMRPGSTGNSILFSQMRLWESIGDVSMTTTTYAEEGRQFRSTLSLSITALKLDDERDTFPERGLADFARVCLRRGALPDETPSV